MSTVAQEAGQMPAVAEARPDNAQIASIFAEIADLLELQDQNPFRIRAYRNAARTIAAFAPDIASLFAAGSALPKLPGVGAELAGKIHEIVETGSCELWRKLRQKTPPSLIQLLAVAGLGPKRVRRLYRQLGIKTRQQLYEAAAAGRLNRLPGFGSKLQDKLLHGVESRLKSGERWQLSSAVLVADQVLAFLKRSRTVTVATAAGSLRRMRETVGDVDIVAAARDPAAVMKHFLQYQQIAQVLAQGPTRASVTLRSGLQVDLRVVEPQAYGAALVYFTGSKAHNIALRKRAQGCGLKLSEYGLFKGQRCIAGDTEASIYRALHMVEVPPELREDRGEIEAAQQGRLPQLIELSDLKGDLHAHSQAFGGTSSLEELAAAARAAGLEYLAITDHLRSLRIAHGFDQAALLRQAEEIDTVNRQLKGITVLRGVEVEILESGELDMPNEILARVELVVAAVHSHFGLARDKQTRRVLRAIEHPRISILAHPFGRVIGERAPIDIDMSRVIRAIRQRGCAIELNAQPSRLDLFDVYCREAKEQGVPVCISSDAHGIADFANLRYGVGQARRGWLEKCNVLNTRTLPQLRQFLKQCAAGR